MMISSIMVHELHTDKTLKDDPSINLYGSNSPPLAARKKTPIRLIPRPLGRGGFIKHDMEEAFKKLSKN